MNMLRLLFVTIILAAFTALSACQTGGTVTPGRTASDAPKSSRIAGAYALGTGDRLRITVFGEPDLSGQFEVDGTGAISISLIGQVMAAGLTTQQLEQTISTKLADGYMRHPQVSAEIINYRPYYILGEVNTAGEYPYNSGLSVLNAVASAGGFTYRANKRVVYIKSMTGGDEVAYELNSQILVQPGDTIRIGERIF